MDRLCHAHTSTSMSIFRQRVGTRLPAAHLKYLAGECPELIVRPEPICLLDRSTTSSFTPSAGFTGTGRPVVFLQAKSSSEICGTRSLQPTGASSRFDQSRALRSMALARNKRDFVAETEIPANSAISVTRQSLDR